jgi:Putative auto-transporter adhesin, head GIN domain
MAHKLVIIAVIGLSASAVCMGAAAAIGGPSFGDGFDGIFDGRPRCEAVAGAAATSRTLDWDDSDHVELSVNGRASYAPSSDDKIHASGDPQILAHLRVRKGDIEMDCRGWRDRTKELALTLPGREFRKFEIAGGSNLVLDKLDQSSLKIEIAGSGTVKANGNIGDLKIEVAGSGKADLDQITAREAKIEIAGSGDVRVNGKVDNLKMEIAGSGDADFTQITARMAKIEIAGSGTVKAKGSIEYLDIEIAGSGRADFGEVTSRTAKVEIGGHGNVDIAPSEEARAEISGSGDVTLHSDPKRLETDISGSGRIHRLAGGS